MAVLSTLVRREFADIGEIRVLDLQLDNAYTFGGYLLTAKDLKFLVGSELRFIDGSPLGDARFQFVPDPDLKDRGRLRVLGPGRGDDFLLNPALLAIGTVSKKEVAHGTFTKSVGGAVAEVAAAEVGFTATTHDITADPNKVQEAIYLLSVDAAGTVTITKGATADEGAAVPPALPAGEAPLGTVKIKVAAGATDFDATTDDLDAAHLTTTFTDIDDEPLEGADLSGLTVRAVARGR